MMHGQKNVNVVNGYHCFGGVCCRHIPKRRQMFTNPQIRDDLNLY